MVGGLLELEGDFGKPDFDFNFVVLLLGDGLLLLEDFGGGLLAVGNLFGGGLCFFFGLSELTLLLFRGCNLPAKNEKDYDNIFHRFCIQSCPNDNSL